VAGLRSNRVLSGVVASASLVLAAAVLALAPAGSASAHDYLVASTPKADSTQTTALSKVVLTFDDRVLDLSGDGSSNVVQVTGPDDKHFESGCPVVADTDVTVPVKLGDSGEYTVTWQIVSADGHTVSASIGFRYERPQEVAAAVGRDGRPTCGDQSSGGGTSTTAAGSTAATGASSNGLGIALGVGGGIIAVALIAVVVVLVRNRPAPPEA
jgi:methionine-rich copper-binding protein CopC